MKTWVTCLSSAKKSMGEVIGQKCEEDRLKCTHLAHGRRQVRVLWRSPHSFRHMSIKSVFYNLYIGHMASDAPGPVVYNKCVFAFLQLAQALSNSSP
jgi:hypothetical protein